MYSLLKEGEKIKSNIQNEKNIMDSVLANDRNQVVIYNNEFENLIEKQKKEYKFNNKNRIETQIKELKNIKKPLSEVKVGVRDSMGANLFFIILIMLGIFDVNNYWMYIMGPLAGYLFGYYLLPKKIKVIDHVKIKKMEESIDLKSEEGFENIVADRQLLSAFKKEFGSASLENVFLNSLKEQKISHLENNENKNVSYNITIGDLLKQVKTEKMLKNEKHNVREVVEVI